MTITRSLILDCCADVHTATYWSTVRLNSYGCNRFLLHSVALPSRKHQFVVEDLNLLTTSLFKQYRWNIFNVSIIIIRLEKVFQSPGISISRMIRASLIFLDYVFLVPRGWTRGIFKMSKRYIISTLYEGNISLVNTGEYGRFSCNRIALDSDL